VAEAWAREAHSSKIAERQTMWSCFDLLGQCTGVVHPTRKTLIRTHFEGISCRKKRTGRAMESMA
jgi:hypothetical protein